VVHGRRGGAAAAPRRAGAGHGVQAAQAKLGRAGVGELTERGQAGVGAISHVEHQSVMLNL